jgi:hypothetical protein
MKFWVLLFIIILSCSKNDTYIDVDGPVLEDSYYKDKNLILQFDEPVKSIKIIFKNGGNEHEKIIMNNFPVANNIIPVDFRIAEEKLFFSFEALDLKNNKTNLEDQKVIVNINPAKILIKNIKIKYSKNRSQEMVLNAVKSGYTTGFKLVIFDNKNKVIIPLENEFLSAGNEFVININKSENRSENNNLKFSDKNCRLNLKNRFSQTQGLIYITDSNDEIGDYYFYYNLKKHNAGYFEKNKSFQFYKRELETYDIGNPVINNVKN